MRVAIVMIACALGVSPAAAASKCESLGEAIAARTNAKIVAVTSKGGDIVFSHPAAQEMELKCDDPDEVFLVVEYRGAPGPRFFRLAAVGGEVVVGEPIAPQAIDDCLGVALARPDGETQANTKSAHLSCAAGFEGGGYGSVSIAKRGPGDE